MDYNGHLKVLNVSGLWLKKKAAILRDNPDVSEQRFSNAYPGSDGIDRDWRTTLSPLFPTVESIASYTAITNKDDYFFLPAFGQYVNGWLRQCGTHGYYWSSTANQWDKYQAYTLTFYHNGIDVRPVVSYGYDRAFTFPVVTFE